MTRHRPLLLAASLPLILLAGCKQDAAPAAGNAASGIQAAIEQAAGDAADAGALPGGDAPLQPGQSVQGMIEADVGKGTQRFRSLSTKVADDIAEQLDDKLATRKGSQALEEANRKLEKLGTGMKVDAGDVRDVVGSMAGKTFHEAVVQKIDIIHMLQVNLSGKAGDGSQVELSMRFDDKTLALDSASLNYRPNSKAVFDAYSSKTVQVTIERFERTADDTYAIAGTFSAKDLTASPMAKKLDSKTLPSASGRFDYASLPLKAMPKFGR